MITVNKDLNKQWVDDKVKEILADVQENASNGIAETEIYIPKEIYGKVCDELEKTFKSDGTKYTWKQIAPSYRDMYGSWRYPISEDYGDEKRRVLKILS